MNDSNKNSRALSSDELWAKAAQGGSTSREELGIGKNSSSNGVTSLNEGAQKWTFELNRDRYEKQEIKRIR